MKRNTNSSIRTELLKWHRDIDRALPWKADQDPYKIWLSEIIMQQTRVDQGTPYYLRFLDRFPTVHDLAAAPIDEVLKTWEGLGYYQRARNLHHTAQYIANEQNGTFPETYEGLLALKGVGLYTAAAIASFAYDLPYVVVDGNVIRFVARLTGLDAPVNEQATSKKIRKTAEELLSQDQPAAFNQAIMDFGSLVCRPKNPSCLKCPVQKHCVAHATNRVHLIPHKKRNQAKRKRFFYYFVLNRRDKVMIRKRTSKDIWNGLYEFHLIESEKPLSQKELREKTSPKIEWSAEGAKRIHQLSHQTIECTFIEARIKSQKGFEEYVGAKRRDLENYAFPRALDWYLNDKAVTLKLLF